METPSLHSIVYYQKEYFQTQKYEHFIAYSTDDFFFPIDIVDKKAISIPRSPFGSIYRPQAALTNIGSFLNEVKNDLISKGIHELFIHHPPAIYKDIIPANELYQQGAELMYNDTNQHIVLNAEWEESMHKMQQRKLDSLQSEGFVFRRMEDTEFETAHKFLTVCRQAQGLQINISWDHLTELKKNLPNAYKCFGVFRDDKISALCIAVNVTDDIAYYYLPATSPMFRNQSPMVMLIAGMVDYYRSKNYKFLDLGVSSFEGEVQETLKLFKDRMGASVQKKPTFKLVL